MKRQRALQVDGRRRKRSKRKRRGEAKKRNLRTAELQSIRLLSDQVGQLIPLSGYRSSFSLRVVAKEMGLTSFLPKKDGNKKEVFAVFFTNLFQYRPRTPKIFLRAILPKAIEKRHHEGNPVLAAEAEALAARLRELGVDMDSEIAAMNLPTERPRVVPPPIEIQKIVEGFKLHPRLLPDCLQLFKDGHINESVRKALDRFESTVQQLSGLNDRQGPDLMAQAFSETAPRIALNDLNTPQEMNEQRGFKFLAMGIMHWWRNTLSHGDAQTLPHQEAVGRLFTISNLFARLDERTLFHNP